MDNHTQTKRDHTRSITTCFVFLIIIASILSSCNVIILTPVPTAGSAALTATPQASATLEITLRLPAETATETPPVLSTPRPTSTFTPDPVEIANQEVRNKEEIVKNISDFLNSEGKFTPEEIKKNAQYFFGETDVRDGLLPLGWVTAWHGQFMLLGSVYDANEKYLHFYLGATDLNKNRVVFDFNFKRHYGNQEQLGGAQIPQIQLRTSLYSRMGMASRGELNLLFSEDEWNDFIAENLNKPISLNLPLDSQEERFAKRGHPNHAPAIDYDLASEFRFAIYFKIAKYGEALRQTNPPVKVYSQNEQENLKCFWTQANFKGMESLNAACPSNNQIIQITIRRP